MSVEDEIRRRQQRLREQSERDNKARQEALIERVKLAAARPLVATHLVSDDELKDMDPAAGRFPLLSGLWSHIWGNLWQGGCVDGIRLPDEFRFVVSLYPWERYEIGPKTTRIEEKLYDSEDQDLSGVLAIARRVNHFATLGRTLVHCQAGLNRSGLVVGTALVLQGLDPVDAVALQRMKRDPYVLCNHAFERFVLELTPERIAELDEAQHDIISSPSKKEEQ